MTHKLVSPQSNLSTRKRYVLFKRLVGAVVAVAAAVTCLAQPALADGSPGAFAISAGIAFQNLPSAEQTPPTLGFEYGFPTQGKTGQPIVYLDLRGLAN